ncbi:MAG TPA: amidohydrolase family protein, partial [Candidatus Caenarcaniphilales bacterium]
MSATSYDLLLRRCRLLSLTNPAPELVDIGIQAGRVSAIAPHLKEPAQTVLDIGGQLVSPPFVDSHIHLDSALTAGEPRWNQSGTLFEGIQIWSERKQSLTLEDVKARAIETLRQQATQGVLWVRTHADVSE